MILNKIILYLFLIKVVSGYINYKIYNASPKDIITTYNVFNSINNDIAILIKDNLYNPLLFKESIYLPIIILFITNQFLEYKFKNRNYKLNKIDFVEKYKIKSYVNNGFLLFNLLFVRDIENAI
jgi:hypothetical protein